MGLKKKIYAAGNFVMSGLDKKVWDYCINLPKIERKLSVENPEKLPEQGPALLLANHFNYSDPLWIGHAYYRHSGRGELDYMMQDRFFGNNWLMNFGINAMGAMYNAHLISREKPKKSQIGTFISILQNKERFLLVFPGGQRSRSGKFDESYHGRQGREYKSQIMNLVNIAQKKGPEIKVVPTSISYNNIRRTITVSFGDEMRFPANSSKKNSNEVSEDFLNNVWKKIGIGLKASLDSIGAAYVQGYVKEFSNAFSDFKEVVIIPKRVLNKDLFSIVSQASMVEDVNLDKKLLDKSYFKNELNGFIRYWWLKGVLKEAWQKSYAVNSEAALSRKTNKGRILKTSIEYAKNRIMHKKELTEIIENTARRRVEKLRS